MEELWLLTFARRKQSNARHHPPAQEIEFESYAVAGRVHAVVRWRPSLEYAAAILLLRR
jgi:hypothetical protein